MERLVLSYVWQYLLIKTATDDLKGKVLSQACQRKMLTKAADLFEHLCFGVLGSKVLCLILNQMLFQKRRRQKSP